MSQLSERDKAVSGLTALMDCFVKTMDQPKPRQLAEDEFFMYSFSERQLMVYRMALGQALSYLLLETGEESGGNDKALGFELLLGDDDPGVDKT